jgi:hypothetical protein
MTRQISDQLKALSARLDEENLTEEQAVSFLLSALEEAGYEVEADSTDDLMEAVSDLIESDEFDDLEEGLGKKIAKGFKMVFGKLVKVGKGIKKQYKARKTDRKLHKAFIKASDRALGKEQGDKDYEKFASAEKKLIAHRKKNKINVQKGPRFQKGNMDDYAKTKAFKAYRKSR